MSKTTCLLCEAPLELLEDGRQLHPEVDDCLVRFTDSWGVAVDESIDATQCGGKENCRDEQKCITHDLWVRLNEHLLDYLGSITLKQLVDDQIIAQNQSQNRVSPLRNMHESKSTRQRVTVSV